MILVVRVINRYSGTDTRQQSKNTERGDVIEVLPDNYQFNGRSLELTSNNWVVVRIATMSRAKAEAMKAGEQVDERTNPLGRIRAFSLNLETLISLGYPFPTLAEVSDSKYTRSVGMIDITEPHFDLAKTTKAPLSDRAVIG